MGRVVDGKVVVDDDFPLPEGAIVGVMIRDPEGRSELTPEQEEQIALVLEEIKRGERVSLDELRAMRRARR